jgi:pyroglutamyl-peptidase
MPLTVLITGFGPFPGAPLNPTAGLAQHLAARRRPAFADVKRIAHVFETSYAAVERELPALIKRVRPDVVLLFGVATRTNYVRIELRACNARSALFPDAVGDRPRTSAIALGEPAVLAGRAPQQAVLAAVRAQRLPARLSHSAGRYLCNFAYWHAIAKTDDAAVVQFIHVPTVRRGPTTPGNGARLTSADLQRAGEAILTALVVAARARRTLFAQAAAVAVPPEAQREPKRERRQAVAG